jgi:RNAse (barnase) inhibitor barstar
MLVSTLLSMKPGSFDPSRNLEALVDAILDNVKIVELPIEVVMKESQTKLHELFDNYDTLKIEVKREEEKK